MRVKIDNVSNQTLVSQKHCQIQKQQRGFTLIELLVVIAHEANGHHKIT